MDAGDDQAVRPFPDHLRHGAVVPGDDGGARGHGLYHDQPEGLGPVDREEQGERAAQEGGFLVIGYLADELDQRMVEQRLDPLLEIIRSEEHTSELQSLMRISYAVFCLKKKKSKTYQQCSTQRYVYSLHNI